MVKILFMIQNLNVKNITHYTEGSGLKWCPCALIIKSILFSALVLTGIQAPLQAQGYQFTKPSWWFGAAGGANFGFQRGSTQQLNSNLTAPAAFHRGNGTGYYAAPLIEYHGPGSVWGFMLQAGHESRNGRFDQINVAPCNCPADLNTHLSYITVEPSLRLSPFKSGFYLYGGPRLAINLKKSFSYKLRPNPGLPDLVINADIQEDLSNVHKTLFSMQMGAGYDIPLSAGGHRVQTVFSPFVSFQPYFGQSPRSIETWSVTNLRVGAALKFGSGRAIPTPVEITFPITEVGFTINSPKNIPIQRRVRETFPLRNYVFFNIGSTEIPDRYVMLRKDQVKDFKEDQLEVFTPKNLSGRSGREMTAYYNVLNILGDRMEKNPSSTITLVGSSEKGPADGMAMATSVKRYLTDIFGIDAARMSIEGREKPKIPSEQPGGTRDLDLLREGDRRVSIESLSSALLMEFQSGGDVPFLKPVEMDALQEAPLDSYLSFNVDGAREALSFWSLEIRDEKGALQSFGPYTQEKVSIPGKFILGSRPKGDFKVTMNGQTKSGQTVKKETDIHMVQWSPPKNEQAMRYSVIFEFNESNLIPIYEKYLTEVVAPKIPAGAMVIVHGYTDIIGEASNNQKLSLARATDVKNVLKNNVSKAGRNDVNFEAYGFGEDEVLSPYENRFPEERFYNRTVIIDIIPQK